MLCQLKQSDQLNRWHGKMDILAVEEVFLVSGYPLLESMGFDDYIYADPSKVGKITYFFSVLGLYQALHMETPM